VVLALGDGQSEIRETEGKVKERGRESVCVCVFKGELYEIILIAALCTYEGEAE
jgi:hypothetical protein